MVAGFNMLSFDLFGLGRKAQEDKLKRESGFTSEPRTKDDSEQHDRDQEHELFFWSLYPVI
ncbi:hypothetical protein [Agrobacterium rubi]|uniref:Uncharacterized protein n=2 Tax=Agrobacterium rubi TaxID=28099 RepID=A0AAE7R9J8_9HYPH|nr:hypothetical protein [Agrobacterium rubi]MBP1878476.1 hypothetical protein [Agrobacterium rubi]MCL6653157.1 hypothetical protein [Agrobacterium rubi]NTE88909.1 hypothetical protein [Agrobacterium rubi]NTF04737.1 hypothetical protein [Agrobacterium rubi]NTF10261.1 hypothetical protein [Agrobacterium rubi]